MQIFRLEDSNNKYFDKLCEWSYNWWGIENNHSYEEVRAILEHSLCTGNRLPQTYIAVLNNDVVGMYQIAMADDLHCRPDLYPWLISVYVDEKYRGQGICKDMMNTVSENAKLLGISELYLYTKHIGLYEKYGWKFIQKERTFREDSPIERIYRLDIL